MGLRLGPEGWSRTAAETTLRRRETTASSTVSGIRWPLRPVLVIGGDYHGHRRWRRVAIRLDLARRVSDEELLLLSERNPGYQFERTAKGELVVSPTGGESGRRSMAVAGQLWAWNRRTGLGVAFDSLTGFDLPDGSCLSPDAAWVSHGRWEELSPDERKGFVPLCPDAVFEVRSPSNRPADLRGKMRAYLANGARLAVLIDPESRAVEVWRPGREPERYENPSSVALDQELPGFTLELEPVFD
ncbi:MAG: Uma2 family endonuclease [Chloroflexi bacterium]|nr:Uma2 family endonuclease [Chloroflexota bacterium]